VWLADLSPSLLAVAKKRIARLGLEGQATAITLDASRIETLPFRPALITYSFSLTMIPEWWRTLEAAERLLESGGYVGAADFYVAPKFPAPDRMRHSFAMRNFWRAWFEHDAVFLSPDHLPYLMSRFHALTVIEDTHRLPYLPLLRAPYYVFLGQK
jgi:S-adenosylmethionine-diacylgycerolhomoserine-N-methlytransferase